MPLEVLRFESSIVHYGVSSDEEPYFGQVDQLTVRELYNPPTDPELPSGVHNYGSSGSIVETNLEKWENGPLKC
jgi:hypothetical protein